MTREALTEIVETDRGVLAVAARGRVVPEIRVLLREDALEPTFQLGTTGDVALVLRERRELVVRLEGCAEALLLRDGGRLTWLEGGIFHYPVHGVAGMVLVVGFELEHRPGLRRELEAWVRDGADPSLLVRVSDMWFGDVIGLVGKDTQRRSVHAEQMVDTAEETDEGLFDLLAEVAEWDDRATPAVIRRVAGPRSVADLTELAPNVFEAESVSTLRESGPPFRPVLLVDVAAGTDALPSFAAAAAAVLEEPPDGPPDEPPTTLEREATPDVSTLDSGLEHVEHQGAPAATEPRAPERSLSEVSMQPAGSASPSSPEPRTDAERYGSADDTPFSIDPLASEPPPRLPPDTPVRRAPEASVFPVESRVPLWAGVTFAAIVIVTTFVVSWIFLAA